MSPRLRQLLTDLFSPLTLAAYVAWAVVWVATLGDLVERQSPWVWPTRLALLGFLGAFLLVVTGVCRQGRCRILLILLLAGSALLPALVRPGGTSPILLVLLAAVLAVETPLSVLVALLAAVNGAVLAGMLLAWHNPLLPALISSVAFASFQAFAVLLIRSATRAEQMAADLRAANAELLTSRTLLAAGTRDAERLRLSRELHDVAGHGLTALKLNLRALAADPRQPDPERVRLCAELADELLGNLRAVVGAMRQDDGLDLAEALARQALPFPRPRLHLQIADGLRVRGRERIEAILRAVQEALTNAARHGPARELRVSLQADEAMLRLVIEDDGHLSGQPVPGGGLSGMRERFEALSGGLRLGRAPAGGLRIEAWLPKEAGS